MKNTLHDHVLKSFFFTINRWLEVYLQKLFYIRFDKSIFKLLYIPYTKFYDVLTGEDYTDQMFRAGLNAKNCRPNTTIPRFKQIQFVPKKNYQVGRLILVHCFINMYKI